MQTLKYKQIHLLILLMMSMGYFTVVSEWEIDYLYKILILMLHSPVNCYNLHSQNKTIILNTGKNLIFFDLVKMTGLA